MSRYPKVPAKIGTIPMTVWLRSRKPLAVGARVEFRERERGPWITGRVTGLTPLPFIAKM